MGAKRFHARRADVAVVKTDGRDARKADRNHARAGVLDADDVVAALKGNAEAHAHGLRIEPRMRLGRKLTERADLALAERVACGDDAM